MIFLIVFLLTWFAAQPAQSQNKVQLNDFPKFDLLREQFEKDSGKVRLIVLLSPT